MTSCRFAVLALPLLCWSSGPDLPEHARDDFRKDSREDYQVTGTVTWQKGSLTLGPGATLTRTVKLGQVADFEVALSFPAGQGEAELRLRLGDGPTGPAVALRRDGDRVRLLDRNDRPEKAAAAGPAGQAGWRLRVQFGWGLLRAKAWPDGAAEPAAWGTTRFLDPNRNMVVGAFRLEAGAGGLALRRLRVRGPSLLTLTDDQRALLKRANALAVKAAALRERGQFREALPPGEEALALYRRALPAGHPGIALRLTTLATTHFHLGRLEGARDAFAEALALRRRALPPGHPDIARALGNLGGAYQALGQMGRARGLHEEALTLFRETLPDGHPDVAQSLNNLAIAYMDLGQPEQAVALLTDAVAALRRGLPAGHPLIAQGLSNLANIYQTLGQLERARALQEEALALREKALPKGHPDIGQSLDNLANAWRALGQPLRARELQERALALRRDALPAGHPDIARSLNNLGATYEDLGQPEKALALSEEALALRRKALPAGHPDIARSLHDLAAVHARQGRHEKARELYAEALALSRKALPPGHPDVLRTRHNLATMAAEVGRWDEAWRSAREVGVQETDYLTRVLAGSPQRDHLPLLARALTPNLLGFLAERSSPSAEHARLMLDQVAARQALAGLAARLRHEAALVSRDARAGEAYGRLKEARQQLADLLLRGTPARDAAGYRARCAALQQRLDGLEREMGRLVGGYVPLAEAVRTDLDRVAGALAEGEAFVSFLTSSLRVRNTRTRSRRYAALLLWRGPDGRPRVRFVNLGEAGPVDEAVRDWRAAVQQGKPADGPNARLRRRLWGPLAQALPPGTRQRAVVPDGQLALLPLGALGLEDGSFVLEHFAVRYVGAARDLLPARGAQAAAGPAVLVSDPAFDLAAPAGTTAGSAGAAPPGRQFRRLPGFAREAAAAAKLLRGRPGWEVRALRGEAATEEAVAALTRPRLLYLITHGFFREDVRPQAAPGLRDLDLADLGGGAALRPALGPDPRLRSGLALAGANRWQERSKKGASDGLLTAAEVENLDLLGTELVILSACETGLGEVQVGEGVLGLRRAFQLAGAQTVVASLWKVPDDQTEQLMTGFLKRWLDGAGKADALRQAQLDLIRQLRKSADAALRQAPPLYWAGFVCHGRPD